MPEGLAHAASFLAVFSRVALCTGFPRIQCFSLSFSFGYTRPVRLRAFWCWPSSLFATMYLSDRVLTLIHGFSKPKTTVCAPSALTKGERAVRLFGYVAPRGPLRGFGVWCSLLTSGRRAIYKPSNYAFPSTRGGTRWGWARGSQVPPGPKGPRHEASPVQNILNNTLTQNTK